MKTITCKKCKLIDNCTKYEAFKRVSDIFGKSTRMMIGSDTYKELEGCNGRMLADLDAQQAKAHIGFANAISNTIRTAEKMGSKK